MGHAYDPQSLLAQDETAAEQAIWAAIRAVEERLSLSRKLETRARAIGDHDEENALSERIAEAERQVATLRSALGDDADQANGRGEA